MLKRQNTGKQSLSGISNTIVESELLRFYGVRIHDKKLFTTNDMEGFEWTDADEDKQAAAYTQYLEQRLALKSIDGCEIINADDHKDFLTTTPVGGISRLTGACDCAVVDPSWIFPDTLKTKIFVAMEMKKPKYVISAKSNAQAIATHFAADISSNFPVITLLTDLDATWILRWFILSNSGTVLKTVRYDPSVARDLLEQFIRYSSATARDPTQTMVTLPDDFEGIIKLQSFSNLRAAAEPQDMDMDRDGDNDVARMEDVLEGDELEAWKKEKLLQNYLRYSNIFADWRFEQNEKFEILGV